MNKTILSTAVILALSSGVAHADVIVNGTHQSAVPNMIEDYFIQANSSGSSNIFLASHKDTVGDFGGTYSMDGVLSVWQEVGSNWTLIGANDDAARNYSAPVLGSKSVYGTPTLDFLTGQPNSGKTDPGLTLNLTAGSTYMIIQSESRNGPTSLSNLSHLTSATGAGEWAGFALGQTFAVGANPQTALWGTADAVGAGPSAGQYTLINPYTLTVTGNVALVAAPSAVPLPAAVWLFGSALAGLGVIGRKKAGSHRLA
jgi:hypothetical protein